jgi:hypothetical protein
MFRSKTRINEELHDAFTLRYITRRREQATMHTNQLFLKLSQVRTSDRQFAKLDAVVSHGIQQLS